MGKRPYSRPAVRERLLGFTQELALSIDINFMGKELSLLAKPEKKNKKNLSFASVTTKFISGIIIFLAILVGAFYFAPQLYYQAFSPKAVALQAQTNASVLGGDFSQGTDSEKAAAAVRNLPDKDEDLPKGDWIIIPKIGVRTELIETEKAEDALNKGVWKVPGYGEAGSQDQPMILAAHRYGFKWMWESVLDGDTYALRNIFYKLPETQVGDIIEIISNQRRYTYEIYAGEENTQITYYDADLILYTCKFINSPTRLIRYARLVDL